MYQSIILNVAAIFACLIFSLSSAIHAAPVTAVDLATLPLGAKIVGPVGPEVETTMTFTNPADDVTGIADLSSSVSCDARFIADCSATAVAGFNDVVYTYQHQVIPGVDLPNDPPFPAPGSVVALNGVTEFRLQFPAHGFLGVAGFDFGQAGTAIGSVNIGIEQLGDGSLVWTLPNGSGWDTGETITFFWQTTQRPSGPGGVYAATNQILSGTGNGPIPQPLPIPAPATGLLLLAGLLV
ncbi:MAG TPA: hypothetical protein PKM20_06760, partial [Nitrosomonas sp.]|nr:hypothetical protein [Nitrosomonas sp.]